MVAKLVGRFVIFQDDPIQYCKETLYFCDFSGGGGGGVGHCPPPYRSAHALTFLLKQLEANSSLVINAKTFLLVDVVVFLQINAIAQNIAFKAVPTIYSANVHFFFTVYSSANRRFRPWLKEGG